MGDVMLWIGKKVYLKLKNSNRSYSGVVIDETNNSIIIRDIRNHIVRISLDECSLLQEEFR